MAPRFCMAQKVVAGTLAAVAGKLPALDAEVLAEAGTPSATSCTTALHFLPIPSIICEISTPA